MEFLIAVVVIMAIILLSCINVVPQARAYVIERLGGYREHGESEYTSKSLLSTELQEKLI